MKANEFDLKINRWMNPSLVHSTGRPLVVHEGAWGVIEESHKIWGKYGFAATMGSRCITRKSTVVTGVPYYLWFLHTTAVGALWIPRVSKAIQKTIGYRTALRQAPFPFPSTIKCIQHIFSSDTQTMPAIAFLCIPNKCSLQLPPTFDLIIVGSRSSLF